MSAEETKMLHQEIAALEVHPLIEAQEKTNATTVEFCGFVGTASADVLRLYPGPDISVYVEIPKDAVVYVEREDKASGGVRGKVRVFVSATKEVTEVSRRRVGANESSLSQTLKSVRSPLFLRGTLIDREGLRPAVEGLPEEGKACIAQCEATFNMGASEANGSLYQATQALLQQNMERFEMKTKEAFGKAATAVHQLRECLKQCPVLYPNLENSVRTRAITVIPWYYN